MTNQNEKVIEVTADNIESPGDIPGMIPGYPNTEGLAPVCVKLQFIREHYAKVNKGRYGPVDKTVIKEFREREAEIFASKKTPKKLAMAAAKPEEPGKVIYNKSPAKKVDFNQGFAEQMSRPVSDDDGTIDRLFEEGNNNGGEESGG